jgi:hypothetical protein
VRARGERTIERDTAMLVRRRAGIFGALVAETGRSRAPLRRLQSWFASFAGEKSKRKT